MIPGFKMPSRTFLIFLLIPVTINCQLLIPPREEISAFKPIAITPTSSTCGLELKETLCDNRFQDSKSCSNASSIINCYQICPFGNTFLNLNTNMDQLSLELMEPCEILKDYGHVLSRSKSKYSYLFDRYNNICTSESMMSIWKAFDLKTISDVFLRNSKVNLVKKGFGKTTYSKFNSGFTATFWIQQSANNNG